MANKNRYFHRSGYSPYQLVLGENPRLPRSLLSDDPLDDVGTAEVQGPVGDEDTAAVAFGRKHQLREEARKALMELEARDRVKEAADARRHVTREFLPGQWVYVWRAIPRFRKTHQLQRDRWVGPGSVVIQRGGTVWVAMRTRLWKCSAEQVREATRLESWGAEMHEQEDLQRLRAGLESPKGRVGAVDVESEGPPPREAWDVPGPDEDPGSRQVLPDERMPPASAPNQDPARSNADEGSSTRAVTGGSESDMEVSRRRLLDVISEGTEEGSIDEPPRSRPRTAEPSDAIEELLRESTSNEAEAPALDPALAEGEPGYVRQTRKNAV